MNETDNHNKEKVMTVRHERSFSEAVILSYCLQRLLHTAFSCLCFEECSSEELLTVGMEVLQN